MPERRRGRHGCILPLLALCSERASASSDSSSLVQVAMAHQTETIAATGQSRRWASNLDTAVSEAHGAARSASVSAVVSTAESVSLSGFGQQEQPRAQGQLDRTVFRPAASAERQPDEPLDIESLIPKTWACIGPVADPEVGSDPITAFAEIKPLLLHGQKVLERTTAAAVDMYSRLSLEGDRNHSRILQRLRKANTSQPAKYIQDSLPSFPTEYGPGGRTVWGIAYSNMAATEVHVNFTEAAEAADLADAKLASMPKAGWAVATVQILRATTLLVRCDEAFMLDNDYVLRTPDAYEERRAVSVYHLPSGQHHIFVRFRQMPFWCDIYEDTAEARRNVTMVTKQTEVEGPIAVLQDSMMADVVEGYLASPYVAVPVINMARYSLRLHSTEIVEGPPSLTVERVPGKDNVDIAPGQSYIIGLMLVQGSEPVQCKNQSILEVKLLMHTQLSNKQIMEPIRVTVSAACISPRHGGYRVTFLDFDGSVQHMWVAPPNVTGLPGQSCPPEGCPVMLSLHGANVPVSSNWGHNYAHSNRDGAAFPYPAWLVEPSNRHHWGTDWEGPGYDNGLAAIAYVQANLPGLHALEKARMHMDPDRWLLTGHSMGGHGCLVFSVHDPDRLLASLCGACWTSQARYVRVGGSALLDEASSGLLKSRMSEHAADLLARNFRGIPLKLVYGVGDDNVPPREPRYMARLVDSYSGSPKAVNISELPNTGHWFKQSIPEIADFLKMHLMPAAGLNATWQLPPLPDVFEFSVASVSSFGTKGNLKVLQFVDAARPGRLFVRRCQRLDQPLTGECSKPPAALSERTTSLRRTDEAADEVWYVETTNVRRFTFRNPPSPGRLLPKSLVLDGTLFNVSSALSMPGQHFCMGRPASQGVQPHWKVCKDRLWESVQRAGPQTQDGPIHNVLRRAKLCIVHGNGPAQAELALVVANKLYFISRYAVPIIAAVSANMTGMIPAHCDDANLLLIGSPQDNTLTEQHRCAFPYITFQSPPSKGFTLGGMAYTAPGVGLIAMGRLENNRLALVLLGTDGAGLARAGERLPITSFKDGTDYMVLGHDASWQGLGGILAAGYLDPLWRSSTSGWAEADHSVARWQGIGIDDSPEDKSCVGVRARLLQSDEEISAIGLSRPRCGLSLWAAFSAIWSLHLMSVLHPSVD